MDRFIITLWDSTELEFTNWKAEVQHGMMLISDARSDYTIPLSSIKLMQEIKADG